MKAETMTPPARAERAGDRVGDRVVVGWRIRWATPAHTLYVYDLDTDGDGARTFGHTGHAAKAHIWDARTDAIMFLRVHGLPRHYRLTRVTRPLPRPRAAEGVEVTVFFNVENSAWFSADDDALIHRAIGCRTSGTRVRITPVQP